MEKHHVVKGGKTVFGASVGILMLETQFPRIPGDMGNAATWPFPVLYKVVPGASPDRVVRRGAEGLLEEFIAAGQELASAGADGITTTCGFLSLFQDELARAVDIPVATSSLMQVPMVQNLLPPGRQVGILTISAESLSPHHLAAANIPAGTPIVGTDNGQEFTRAVLDDEPAMNVELARADLLDAGQRLMAEAPQLGAIVLECTNMVPYAPDLRRALGVPVYSIYSFVTWFQSGLLPRRFATELIDPRL